MRIWLKWLAAAASLALFCALLSGCKTPTKNPSGTETDPVKRVSVPLFNDDGSPKYVLIRADKADKAEIAVASRLCSALNQATGASFDFETDYDRNPDQAALAEKWEILIGSTNRQASTDALAAIGENQYTIRVVDKKIVIAGKNVKALEQAVNCFIDQWLGKTDGTVKELSAPETMQLTADYKFEVKQMGENDRPCLVKTRFGTKDAVIADIIATDKEYGADPTGKADSTKAIQKALNEVSERGGGTVFLPAGQYKVTGSIKVPSFCTLRGDWQDPELGNEYGTVILDYEKSTENVNTGLFILGGSGGVNGLTVYYPEQDIDNVKPYPFTFYTTGLGEDYMLAGVMNCTVINGYLGIGACVAEGNAHEQFTVDTFRGTFLACGAEVYNQADVGTWENLIISPKYWANAGEGYQSAPEEKILAYTMKNGVGLKLGDLEWTEFANVRVEGYQTGVQIVKGKRIEFAGSLFDFTIDRCEIGLQVNSIDTRWGMVVANSSISGSKNSIVNKTGGRVKMCDVKLTGDTVGRFIVQTKGGSGSYQLDYTRGYEKPADHLYYVELDKNTDISAYLQIVLDKAGETGGVVYVPAGIYQLSAPIRVPAGVELRGASSMPNRDQGGKSGGTLFLTTYGMGTTKQDALITLDGKNAGVNGLRILYPENGPTVRDKKTTYAIRGNAEGVYVVNCGIIAAMNGIDFSGCDSHYIKKTVFCCYKNAIRAGGKNGMIDGCLYNGTVLTRLGSIPTKGWISETEIFDKLFSYTRENCEFLILDGAENEMVYNTFAYGVRSLVVTENSTNVLLCNLGADNIGGVQMKFTASSVTAINIMRYNGSSYQADAKSSIELYNRLTIGDAGEATVKK